LKKGCVESGNGKILVRRFVRRNTFLPHVQPSDSHGSIKIRGARTHNLKNVNLDLPRHSLVVITACSGSGKSSLAFDTLYAEGQRRYVESLSAYARQFLQLMEKPDVDLIEGCRRRLQSSKNRPRTIRVHRRHVTEITITCAFCSRAPAPLTVPIINCRWRRKPSRRWSMRWKRCGRFKLKLLARCGNRKASMSR